MGGPKRLARPLWDKKIGGVCAGFARYFEMDVSLIRIIWLVVSLVTGVGLIAWMVSERRPTLVLTDTIRLCFAPSERG
ncbi:MAG: PspC domain-containing protein [Bryobacterales bacterium]|nr:PspC domain-containing protein [Bryobacterales bacterium]